jgi:hypothetical protein
MYFRFKVTDGDATTFTQWTEELDDVAGSNAQRVAIVSRIRAAQPDSAIATERAQAIPNADKPTSE